MQGRVPSRSPVRFVFNPNSRRDRTADASPNYYPGIKQFYKNLIIKGKPFKVAIVAVMRKLLVTLKIMVRKGEMWADDNTPAPAS